MEPAIRIKLSMMMFLQYAIWGSWAVSLGGYLNTLGFTGYQVASIYSSTAIAAMITPLFMGYIADRLIATERLIGGLHLLGAALLGLAATTTEYESLYVIMVVYALCYMPTLALTNSISFANIPSPERDFPGIRVFGTWGWIIVGWIVGFVLVGQSNQPIILAALASAALGCYSFTLPHTPPRLARKDESADEDTPVSGASIFQLLRDRSFLVFVLCSFLLCIPLATYYTFANMFLSEIDAPRPTALQTIGQLSEVGFMAMMPFFISLLGVRYMLIVGMLAWTARYLCFGMMTIEPVILGLILHGICYDFFFVASQIYVDNRVTENQRSSAQSFIAFVTLGVGMFIGNYVGGFFVDSYPPEVQIKAYKIDADPSVPATVKPRTLPDWDNEGKKGLAKEMQLSADTLLDPTLFPDTYQEVDANKQTWMFKKHDFQALVAKIDTNQDGKISRVEWRIAQRKRWRSIWFWPAMWALVTCIIFWVGFTEPRNALLERAMADDAALGAGTGPEPQVG